MIAVDCQACRVVLAPATAIEVIPNFVDTERFAPAPRRARASGQPRTLVHNSNFRPLKHTLSGRDERMFMKLLVDGDSGLVVGCHVMGPDAAEIVQMAAIAMRLGATKADFDATMALHPSAAEELVTMRDKWAPPAPAAKPQK